MNGRDDVATLLARLAHVLWIGGATDAGKTSVAQALAARHRLQAYHYDRLDRLEPPGHWARVDPARHPHMHASSMRRSRDDNWVHTTPEQMTADWLRSTPERFSLSLEDLQALPTAPPIVAEGYGLLPELVAPLLSSPHQAIWLVPTDAFKRASYERRGKGAFFADTSDHARASFNHVGRDLLIGDHVRRSAHGLGQTVVEIDGTRSLEQVIELVAAHFAPHLDGVLRRGSPVAPWGLTTPVASFYVPDLVEAAPSLVAPAKSPVARATSPANVGGPSETSGISAGAAVQSPRPAAP